MKYTFTFLLVLSLVGAKAQTVNVCDNYSTTISRLNLVDECYQNITFRVSTDTLREGFPEVFNYDENPNGGSEYILEIIDKNTNNEVATKVFRPEEYTSFSNGNYIYSLTFNTQGQNSGRFYGKLTVVAKVFLTLIQGGFPQPPKLYTYINTCESVNEVNSCFPAKPNLKLKTLTINNNRGQTYNLSNNQVPNIHFGERTSYTITIENNGRADTNRSPFALFASDARKAFDERKDVYQFYSGDAGAIPSGGSKTVTFNVTFYEYIGSLRLLGNATYFMYTVMDHVDRVNESDETNKDNINEFAWRYLKSTGLNPIGGEDCIFCPVPIGSAVDQTSINNTVNTYDIYIYDFSGQAMLRKQVSGKDEENRIIEDLPKGFYVIKSSKGETWKVSN